MGINNAGVAVGTARTPDGPEAWLWASGSMTNLNDLLLGGGLVLNDAVAINNAGQIVGNGSLNGAPTIYLLTPSPASGVPTPGIWLDPRSLQLAADGTFRFVVQATNITSLVIQISTNLADWVNLSTNAVSQNGLKFQDSLPPKQSRRYYRAKAVP